MLFPAFNLASVRVSAILLLCFSTAWLLLFLGGASQSFWWVKGGLLLQVQAREIANSRPHLSTVIDSPVGAYFTGTQGTLMYKPASFWVNLLLYRIGDITIVDALFVFAVGLYVGRVLLKLRAGREFAPRLSPVFMAIGWLTQAMYFLKSAFDLGITHLFDAQTNHLFHLSQQPGNTMYLFWGMLLLICGHLLHRSEELQQNAALTI